MSLPADNPLLATDPLPAFSRIRPEHLEPAVDYLLRDNRRQIEALLQDSGNYTWDNILGPLENLHDRLNRAWSPASHLHAVQDNDQLRAAYNACLPKLSEYATELGQHDGLYRAYAAVAAGPEYPALSQAQRRIIEHALRDFRLSGIDLDAPSKQRFRAIQQKLSRLQTKFEENVLDATNAFELIVTDKADLAGIPEYAVQAAEELAKSEGKEGYKFTLQFPSYFPVLQYAEKRELRETLYEAYAKRASEFGPAELDNTALIRELLQLRLEEAQMLGYKNFGELSLVPKMANTPDEVVNFLRELAMKAKIGRAHV